MSYCLYNAAWSVAAPVGACWLKHSTLHHELLARFNPGLPSLEKPPLWLQACSVGEVNTARPILDAMRDHFPGYPRLLTSSTAAGHVLATKNCRHAKVTWFPFDARKSVRRFLDQAQPRALVLLETELWPNVLRECARRGIPVFLINGRISDKHLGRYRRFHRFYRAILSNISAIGAQNELHAGRFIELGANPARIQVTGNTKFDGVLTAVDQKSRARLRAENGFPADSPILIFGSTRPGDEELAAKSWTILRRTFPKLRLMVAPRHTDRLSEAMAAFDEPMIRRSDIRNGVRASGERVFFLDTVGELVSFYAIATVAVIGGSFFPGVNGHNPLEPAALGVPTVFGPYMSNFPDPARVLLQARGAIEVATPEELCGRLMALLEDPAEQRQVGTRGRKAVLDHQGAIARNLDMIEAWLRDPPA